MLERAAFVQAVGHRQRLAVIGDGDVLQAQFPRRFPQRPHVVAPVGFGAVHVQVATQIRAVDQAG